MKLLLALLTITALVLPATASAFIVDLTSAAASGSIGDVLFQQVDPQATGTGVFQPFVRLQASPTQSGFNTDAPVGSGDLADVKPGTWTHSILVNDFGVYDLSGTPTVRLMLDINQAGGNNSLLSLDELKIFTHTSPTVSALSDLMTTGTLIYDMDAGSDSEVWLDASLNSGSGSGDMLAYLPVSKLSGKEDQYFYLYSSFGNTYASNAGFEEWARVDVGPIPEPATLLLVGGGLLGGVVARRRRRS